MNVDKLADFGNINTAHGDVEAGFLFFFFNQGSLSLYNKGFLQFFINASLFLEYKFIARQTGLYYLMYL